MARRGRFDRTMGSVFGSRGKAWRAQTTPDISPGLLDVPADTMQMEQVAHRAVHSMAIRYVDTPIIVGKPLSEGERGAVWPIFPAKVFTGPGKVVLGGSLPIPHEDIRTSMLFFDRFDVPDQHLVGGKHWCAGLFASAGILSPSSYSGDGGDLSSIFKSIPLATFLARDRAQPGLWTMARPASALGLPMDQMRPQAAFALTLNNALPTFARDVALDDVLEFKRRAWSELQALRSYLDDLCLEIGHNGVNSFEQTAVFARFKTALEAHIRLMNESNREKVWRSLKTSFDTSSILTPGIEAVFSGHIDTGTVVAGAIGIGVKVVRGLLPKRDASNPFEYLTSASLEL